jgi:hypothetical protein
MQDAEYDLRRIPIPRTPVNKGKQKGRGVVAPALLFADGWAPTAGR